MRLFCELVLVAVLVWLGWSTSFHDRVNQMRGIGPTPAPQVRRTTVAAPSTAAPRQPFLPAYARTRPSSTPSGDWMWDPAHRNSLDRPAYKTNTAQTTPSQNSWIDSRGVRHYTNALSSPTASP